MKPLNIDIAKHLSNQYPSVSNQISYVNSLIAESARGGQYDAIVPGALLPEVEVAFFEAGYEVARISNMNGAIEYYRIKWGQTPDYDY